MYTIDGLPRDMLIEVTNRCNHRCVFCAHRLSDHQQGEIDVALLRRILQEAYDMGLRRVGLYTTGEMFLCKHITEHIANAKEIGFEYIYSDTNGALATEDRMRAALEAGLDSIKFSINAGTRKTYTAIHGHDDFEKVIEHLKICHTLKQQINPQLKIMVSYVITRQNEPEVETLRAMISPISTFFMQPPCVFICSSMMLIFLPCGRKTLPSLLYRFPATWQ